MVIKRIFTNCSPFTDCISEINNTLVDNARDIDVIMPMYNLFEYSDNCSKKSLSLCQHSRDRPAVNNNGVIIAFSATNVTDSFSFKEETTGQTDNNATKDVKLIVPFNN